MPHGRFGWKLAFAGILVGVAVSVGGAEAPPASTRLHDGFESDRPVWRQEATDATIQLIAHDRSKRAAYEGKVSEHFHFAAGPGSQFYYSYPLAKIPVTQDLQARISVRSSRAGVQIYGRVILPADTDPDTGQPSFVLVPGPVYENADRWQRIGLVDLLIAVERQARVIRASTKRPVSIEGAYLDRLVVNLYSGPGETEVYIDDLNVAPVPAEAAQPKDATDAAAPRVIENKPARTSSSGQAIVRNDRGQLKREGFPWVFLAVHAPGADVAALRRAGFSVLADKLRADPKRWEAAVKSGFLLMPDLSDRLGVPPDPDKAARAMSSFPYRDSVAFWNIGEMLGSSPRLEDRDREIARVREVVETIRELKGDGSKLLTATVAGDFPQFARPPRNLDLVGTRPNSWGGAQRPFDTYIYLKQRRDITMQANPGALFWTWIPTTVSPEIQTAIWGANEPPDWGVPQVQPEQIRMQTYLALAAGYRGIGFLADEHLTEPLGRGRTSRATTTSRALYNEMALLNEEIDLVGAILALASQPIPFDPTYPPDPPPLPDPGKIRVGQRVKPPAEFGPHPDIRAASIELPIINGTHKGTLLLVTSTANGAQCQPPQMAERKLNVRAVTRDATLVYEINPGGVSVIDHDDIKREPGGTRITLNDFYCTSLILATTEPAFAEQIEARLRPARPLAVQLAIEQAELQLRWVREVHQQIEYAGYTLRQANPKQLLEQAEEYLKQAMASRDREEYADAWRQARHVGHPLRILMRTHWDQAYEQILKASIPPDHPDTSAAIRSRRTSLTDAQRFKFDREREKDSSLAPLLVRHWSAPPAIAFNTLPALYLYWIPRMKGHSFVQGGKNLIPTGSFDSPETLRDVGWINDSYEYDGIVGKVSTKPDPARPGKSFLKLTVEPADPKGLDKLPPFLDFPAAGVRTPPVRVRAKDFLRISVLVKRPVESVAGMGGIVIRDSIGGEALQFRFSDPSPEWQRVVIYREAPADGTITVSLGLAGYAKDKVDEAYFDDFRIEVLSDPPLATPPDIAGGAPRRANPPATAARPGRPTRTER